MLIRSCEDRSRTLTPMAMFADPALARLLSCVELAKEIRVFFFDHYLFYLLLLISVAER